MAVYTNISQEQLTRLLHNYEIGTLIDYQGITSGIENSNYRIETTDGKFILTIYEDRVDPTLLPFYLGVMRHLSDNNFPCPLPLINKEQSFLSEIEGKHCAIVSFLEGKDTSYIKNFHIEQLGATLAKMHLLLQNTPYTHANEFGLQFWQNTYQSIASRMNEIKPGLSYEIEQALEALATHWPENLPKGIIHADLFPDNVFFKGKELSGVIDFYFACYDILMYDVAICMNAWCFEKTGEFNITKAQKLLKSYHRVRPISPEELEALPVLAKGASMRFLMTRSYDWLHPKEEALVIPHNPLEYLQKLRFHENVTSYKAYGV